MELTHTELTQRRARFCAAMNTAFPDWDTAVVVSKVNQYYFTGTMQDAALLIRKGGDYAYFVRQSHQRATDESPLSNIFPMQSYRDMAAKEGRSFGNTYIEAETMPFAMMQRLQKYFDMAQIGSLENLVRTVRSVKSPYELYWMEQSGQRHLTLLSEIVPSILREGMSEAELVGEALGHMMRLGYQGLSRFFKFQTEMAAGQFGFGESSLYPTSFDGPGGSLGVGPASPVGGSPARRLKKGDLVFVDIGFGVNGYHSDKTQVYLFGGKPSLEMLKAHRLCVDIQKRAAELLKPGAIPARIYQEIMSSLTDSMQQNFMGYGNRRVKFLGHGVGLHVDELPVIADGFDEPLEENMAIALEPKKGIAGVGMVGVEDTYVVTPSGGRCITGGGCDIIVV